MILITYLSIIIAIAGLLVYALSEKAKVAEIGRISFFAGLLAFLLEVTKIVKL